VTNYDLTLRMPNHLPTS